MSVNSKMTAIADQIRTLQGSTNKLGLDLMATEISDANQIIEEQADLLAELNQALSGRGTPNNATLQEKEVMPSTLPQNIYADAGNYGLSKVTVLGDTDLIAQNIKRNVEIFGVKGSYLGNASTTSKTTVQMYVHGSSYTVDGKPKQSMTCQDVPVNSTVTLAYAGDKTFLHWLNDANNILKSGAATVAPTVSTNSHFKAIEIDEDELRSAPYGAYVEFVSPYSQVASAGVWRSDDTASDHVLPEVSSKLGSKALGWTLDGSTVCTAEDIIAAIDGSATHMQINGLYEAVTVPLTITLHNNLNDETATFSVNRGKGVLVSPFKDGVYADYVVAKWTLDAEGTKPCGGYATGCGMFPARDMDVWVHYAPTGTSVTWEPQCWIDSYVDENMPTSQQHCVVREVPSPYTLVQSGVLYAIDGAVDRETAEQTMVLGSGAVSVSYSTSTTRRSAYTLNNRSVPSPQSVVWSRGYIVFKDADGVQHTKYTADIGEYTNEELLARDGIEL